MKEYAAIAIPIAASSTPSSLTANDGRIGISIPKPRRSMNTVINIKMRADLFFKELILDYKYMNLKILCIKYTEADYKYLLLFINCPKMN